MAKPPKFTPTPETQISARHKAIKSLRYLYHVQTVGAIVHSGKKQGIETIGQSAEQGRLGLTTAAQPRQEEGSLLAEPGKPSRGLSPEGLGRRRRPGPSGDKWRNPGCRGPESG